MIPAPQHETDVGMSVIRFDLVITGVHLHKNAFPGFGRPIRHRTVQREIAEKDNIPRFGFQYRCLFDSIFLGDFDVLSAAHHAVTTP